MIGLITALMLTLGNPNPASAAILLHVLALLHEATSAPVLFLSLWNLTGGDPPCGDFADIPELLH